MNIDIMPPDDRQWGPNEAGYFGKFGGRFIPETLMTALLELTQAYEAVRRDRAFWTELHSMLTHYVGRPSPLYHATRLSDQLGGARMYLKREDLNHTGAHKINNTLGQVLLAKRLGKRRVIAETGAGQHGVATATACACCGLECVVYMGAEDVRRQRLNVFRMELLGAKVVAVETGQRTLKDAINAALRDWMGSSDDTHYAIGSVMGPHPYPRMVRDFQSIIGRESRTQILECTGRLPDQVIACVGGGSNAAGIFVGFLDDPEVQLIGIEAAGQVLQNNVLAPEPRGFSPRDAANAGNPERLLTAGCHAQVEDSTRRAQHGNDAPDAGRQTQAQRGHDAAVDSGPSTSTATARPVHDVSRVRERIAALGLQPGRHAATLTAGAPGVLHGMLTYVLQDEDGQTCPVHSVSAGLDYPGVGPEHAHWKETGRVQYTAVDDAGALDAFTVLSRTEGIIPALESAHAVAYALRAAPTLPRDAIIIINLSGRGDKDVQEAARILGGNVEC